MQRGQRRVRDEARESAHLLAELAGEYHETFALLDRRVALEDLNRRVLAVAGVECGFAAPVEAEDLIVIRSANGLLGPHLIGLRIRSGLGLGGRAMAERAPVRIPDYGASRTITHDFDGPVLAEGIRGTFAVPMLHAGAVVGVVWGAMREPAEFGDRVVREVETLGTVAATRLHIAERARAQTEVALRAERRRMADELHDNLGASLFTIGVQIRNALGDCDGLDPMGQDSAVLIERLRSIEAQLDRASATLRESLSALHGAEPHLDLPVTLRSDLEAFAARSGTPARLVLLSELPALDDARARAVVAVTREALLNVEKHAAAGSVVVSIGVGDGGIRIAVCDDGIGIGAGDERKARDGLGVVQSAERVERLGGRFSVVGDQDGTTVRIWMPIDQPPPRPVESTPARPSPPSQ